MPFSTIRDGRPLRIVAIGGGTGLSTLLHGLKRYAMPPTGEAREDAFVDITAVVTVTDDGGSSGRLRRELDVLPPGDIRNCMVALSEDEALMARLFQHRFQGGRGLKGHSFGNLFLSALTQVTGDFAQAVKLSSDILAIRGRIFPSTQDNVVLQAMLEDGSRLEGESLIGRSHCRITSVSLKPRHCRPMPETLEAIAEADLICLGPGSLYTSVIPNLLVHGIAQAITDSTAVKAYFCNMMWQPGETMGYTASDHVAAIERHCRCQPIDTIVLNTRPIGALLRTRYAADEAQPVANDYQALERMGVSVVEAELLADAEKVRHDPAAAALVAVRLAGEGRRRQVPVLRTVSA